MPMLSRRAVFTSLAALALLAGPASAFEFKPYDPAAVDKAIASGKPVVVHVYASWCLQCHMQKSILEELATDKKYDGVQFFRVDYDNQKDIVAKFDCPRSTLISFKGGKELGRMSWGMTQASVTDVLAKAL
jgi:thiol-disulfide isomerase/thioredoxin